VALGLPPFLLTEEQVCSPRLAGFHGGVPENDAAGGVHDEGFGVEGAA